MKVAEERPSGSRHAKNKAVGKRKVRVPKNARLVRFLLHPAGKILLTVLATLIVVGIGVFIHFYNVYSKMIDERLRGGPYSTTARIFAGPESIAVGDKITPSDIAAMLRRAGYNENRNNSTGSYTVKADAIDIFPGADSYFDQEPATVKFAGGKISRIVSLGDNTNRPLYELEPQLITNLSDKNREKQRVVHYEDIPPVLRNAVLSAEDKRFFQHSGFDPVGIVRSAWVDVKRGRNAQGASTLSMQLARDMFLTPARNWRRKLAEIMITMQLEQKLNKQQIFEMYCNQVDLGYRGSFTLRGFGEASQAYFGKDIRSLTLPEAASLAAMVRGASYYNPYRHPDRLRDRRNYILSLMRQNGFIGDRDYALAIETPLQFISGPAESSDAPYFVDMMNDDLEKRFPNYDFHVRSAKIYTSLDLNLQRAANEAVATGMKQVDDLVRKQKRFKNAPFVEPQVALIALDPHTGEIKALVGGRNYGASQLNRAVAERPPGSIFKPFVYAAAMNTAVAGGTRTLTPASIVVDEPTTFEFDGQEYSPNNFEHQFYGPVTLRKALAKSLNVATIKVAEMVGYSTVVNLAHKAGISEDVKATPAMAIGSYDATPIEMAGAWTIFANHGTRVQPSFVSLIKESNGHVLLDQQPVTKPVLDPRVDYLVVSMLEEVMRTGTAAGVRSRGFTAPAAGKTGTSHDGWFAGFTSDLLCIVWVGFDDNRELDIEGAHSALPIWTDFMKRALTLRKYADAKEFDAPSGVVTVTIDPESGMPAGPQCPMQVSEVFIAGTEPVGACPLHGGKGDRTTVSGWDIPAAGQSPNPQTPGLPPLQPLPYVAPRRDNGNQQLPAVTSQTTGDQTPPPAKEKKKGFFGKLKDVFR
ncbi:MAG TPA: PBP1A family penicillin-binding protein [Bryobacteraceae bacterium]|jgi:penicillin-binding protein 1B|nr:PBP1A family penicillin-binding protein [Bryobacteraceae bacterium]